MNCCPTCGRKIQNARAPRGLSSEQKKFQIDRTKALAAIEVLKDFSTRQSESESFRSACLDELIRLESVKDSPEGLRAIYRRNERKPALVVVAEPAIAEPIAA
jgi:hypothetical protein